MRSPGARVLLAVVAASVVVALAVGLSRGRDTAPRPGTVAVVPFGDPALDDSGLDVGLDDRRVGHAVPVAGAGAVPSPLPAAALPASGIEGPAPGPFVPADPIPEPQDPACLPAMEVPASARQLVVVTHAGGARATLDLLVHDGVAWRCGLVGVDARVGREGIRPLAQRRSGDGTTPSGLFALGTAAAPDGQSFEFFGNGPDPGVQGTWRQVRVGDCWVATPGHPEYNTLVTRPQGSCRSPDEYLPAIVNAYSAAALIDANMGPDRSGDDPAEPPLAAAIFLHRHAYAPNGTPKGTSGCVSLDAADLATVLRALRPGEAWFVIR